MFREPGLSLEYRTVLVDWETRESFQHSRFRDELLRQLSVYEVLPITENTTSRAKAYRYS